MQPKLTNVILILNFYYCIARNEMLEFFIDLKRHTALKKDNNLTFCKNENTDRMVSIRAGGYFLCGQNP
jgi:hypothetical protein